MKQLPDQLILGCKNVSHTLLLPSAGKGDTLKERLRIGYQLRCDLRSAQCRVLSYFIKEEKIMLKRNFLITMPVPFKMAISDVKNYMKEAIESWSGQFHPLHPYFGTLHGQVKVTTFLLKKPIIPTTIKKNKDGGYPAFNIKCDKGAFKFYLGNKYVGALKVSSGQAEAMCDAANSFNMKQVNF